MIKNITGIILAGGKSSRMGKDKAFIMFGGKPLIEIIVDKLSGIFYELMIVTNKPNLYDKYGIETQTDIKGNCGPLGGIYTGLVYSKNRYNFVIACDTPFINLDLIRYMYKNIRGFDVVVPKVNNKYEPLFCVYSKKCLKFIKGLLDKKVYKIQKFYPKVKIRKITKEEVLQFAPPERIFINVNTPKDLKSIIHE